MNEFIKAVENRRSIYNISNEAVIADEKLKELVETIVANVPSAFNSQTARVVLLVGESHNRLWNITLNQLRAIVPAEKFKPTNDKIASFAAGHGTVLYFEEQETIANLQTQFPSYADNFPVWSMHGAGMLQFAIWTALEQEGMGASLQHYNPLIDAEVAKAFNVPEHWKLIAQMPFGKPISTALDKTFLPISERVRVLG